MKSRLFVGNSSEKRWRLYGGGKWSAVKLGALGGIIVLVTAIGYLIGHMPGLLRRCSREFLRRKKGYGRNDQT